MDGMAIRVAAIQTDGSFIAYLRGRPAAWCGRIGSKSSGWNGTGRGPDHQRLGQRVGEDAVDTEQSEQSRRERQTEGTNRRHLEIPFLRACHWPLVAAGRGEFG